MINKKLLTVGLALGLLCAARCYSLDLRKFQEFSAKATALEHQDKWKAIKWQHDFAAAQQQALKEHKPILVFMVVQHRGETTATDC